MPPHVKQRSLHQDGALVVAKDLRFLGARLKLVSERVRLESVYHSTEQRVRRKIDRDDHQTMASDLQIIVETVILEVAQQTRYGAHYP